MANLKRMQDLVEIILTEEPLTRDDDMLLYYLYCTKYGFLNKGNFYKVFEDKAFRNGLGISVYETISRCRRKVQEENENLKASSKIEQERIEQEKRFEEFVK